MKVRAGRRLTAAYGVHDLDLVARLNEMAVKAAAGHDLAIDLQRQALAGQAQRIQQLAGAEVVRVIMRVAIENNVHGQ